MTWEEDFSKSIVIRLFIGALALALLIGLFFIVAHFIGVATTAWIFGGIIASHVMIEGIMLAPVTVSDKKRR